MTAISKAFKDLRAKKRAIDHLSTVMLVELIEAFRDDATLTEVEVFAVGLPPFFLVEKDGKMVVINKQLKDHSLEQCRMIVKPLIVDRGWYNNIAEQWDGNENVK